MKDKSDTEYGSQSQENYDDDDVIDLDSDPDDGEAEMDEKNILSDEKYYATVSKEEMSYLKENFLSEEELEKTTINCTACYQQVTHKQEGSVLRHPDLAVPVCKKCRKYYCSGKWSKDSEGNFEHCRWCGGGGGLLGCDSCPEAFCTKCIKRNLGRSMMAEIEKSDKWKCLRCDPVPIYKQRALYYSIWIYTKEENRKIQAEAKKAQHEKGIGKRKERTLFVDQAIKDGFHVNKIFGNYLIKANKSWSVKSENGVQKADVTKLVVRFRTICKVAHHNLHLLEKNLLEGCLKTYPDVTRDMLKAMRIPEEDLEEGMKNQDMRRNMQSTQNKETSKQDIINVSNDMTPNSRAKIENLINSNKGVIITKVIKQIDKDSVPVSKGKESEEQSSSTKKNNHIEKPSGQKKSPAKTPEIMSKKESSKTGSIGSAKKGPDLDDETEEDEEEVEEVDPDGCPVVTKSVKTSRNSKRVSDSHNHKSVTPSPSRKRAKR